MPRSEVDFFWRNSKLVGAARSGVCLHSHTMHSEEGMDVVFEHALRVPVLSGILRRKIALYEKTHACRLDLDQVYWMPPLGARESYELERTQIADVYGLSPLVSLTDHDSIAAAALLQSTAPEADIPISLEWTVPFGRTYFHLGVHNLPRDHATELHRALDHYKQGRKASVLEELLAALDADPGVLVVFNHPYWNQALIDYAHHEVLLDAFLHQYGRHVHALELNGLRPWKENRLVWRLAQERGYPVVSGGDRHGCEPAAVINLTAAAGFAEFIAEVRQGQSQVMFLPQYREPLRIRQLQTIYDVLGDYPDSPRRRGWKDRVIVDTGLGPQALSELWVHAGPAPIRYFINAIRFFHRPQMRHALKIAFAEKEPAL